MGDLDGALADGDEPAVREHRQGSCDVLVRLDVELRELGAASNDRAGFALLRQAEHQAPGRLLLGFRQPAVRVLG